MATGTGTSFLGLTRGAVMSALLIVTVVAVVLGASWLLIGPFTAQAGYLAVMFLLSPARSPKPVMRLAVAGWAVLVAMLGFLVGPFGLVPTLIGLVLICVGQGMFKVGEVATLTRSPVNFIAFAGLSQTDAQLWQVLLGSLLGASLVLLMAAVLPAAQATVPLPAPVRDRFDYGLLVAAGCVLIVVVGEVIDFPFVGWVLLSFCMTLAVGVDNRRSRARDRVLGTIAGAILATVLTLLPEPFPLMAAVLSMLLCVAYLRVGNYPLFVMFLTPAVLLTVGSTYSAISLGFLRIEAVVAAGTLAMVCSIIFDRLHPRRVSSHIG